MTLMADELSARNPERPGVLGNVVVSSRHIVNPQAFKHAPHPLDEHVCSLPLSIGGDLFAARDAAWKHLVATRLVPLLGVEVVLREQAHNSAYAAFVEGFSCNEDAVPYVSVEVPAAEVLDVLLAALSSSLEEYSPPATDYASARSSGVSALVGRMVVVEFSSEGRRDPVSGILISCSDGVLMVSCLEGSLVSIPLTSVRCFSTSQCVPDETSFG